jgi:choice-of-anchor B domain-containing protein
MKKLLLFISFAISLPFSAQTYSSQNIDLISLISPNSDGTVGIGPDDRRYNCVWGWEHPISNKEFAILGSSIGTYFIDVSNPATPSVSAFVPGKPNCTWREVKTYQNYCYVVSDDPSPNTFQIIDMSALPATVTVVHNGTTYFERGHTLFIDGDYLYIGSTTYSTGGDPFSSMNVYSLFTPTAPVLMRRLDQDYSFINTVHDMFVSNDTVFASCGNQGLYVFKWNASLMNFTQLGSYADYPAAGYNHSSWLTADRTKLVFCDETNAAPIHLVDVQNLSNIQPLSTFLPHPNSVAHNPYVIDNHLAVVSCYQDGVNIYNFANPNNVFLAGFFDTYPQGGHNVGNYFGNDFRGNWGAYPYFSSGILLASDMQNGLFILDPSLANISTGIKSNKQNNPNFIVYPNPASDKISVNYNTSSASQLSIKNMLGQNIFTKNFSGSVRDYVDVSHLENGTYFISLTEGEKTFNKKLIISHK